MGSNFGVIQITVTKKRIQTFQSAVLWSSELSIHSGIYGVTLYVMIKNLDTIRDKIKKLELRNGFRLFQNYNIGITEIMKNGNVFTPFKRQNDLTFYCYKSELTKSVP